MTKLSAIRTVLFAVPALAIAAWALPSPRVEVTDLPAGAGDEFATLANNCTYYNNASHTTVVGQFGYDCCNNPVSWGRKSSFKVCGGCFVCFPPPR